MDFEKEAREKAMDVVGLCLNIAPSAEKIADTTKILMEFSRAAFSAGEMAMKERAAKQAGLDVDWVGFSMAAKLDWKGQEEYGVFGLPTDKDIRKENVTGWRYKIGIKAGEAIARSIRSLPTLEKEAKE